MLFGRPANQIIGTFTIVLGSLVVVLANLAPPIIIPGAVVGAIGAAFGALITIIAGQPPTLNTGDTINVVTPAGQPNETRTV